MKSFDVLIVGGGPAGSTLAWRLGQAGLSVGVLDKKPFPRDKICAGWVTPAVMEELKLDLEAYGRHHTLQPIRGFRIGMLGRPETEIGYDQVVSYGIRRCEFDHYLLERCGATLLLGEALRAVERDRGQWRVNGDYVAPLLVGAGGHFCPVARQLGAALGSSETVVAAQEIEFRLDSAQQRACPVDPAVPELFFCPDLKGYGWIFRKGDYLNIGLGREDNRKLSTHVAEFVARLKAQGRVPADLPDRFGGHAYLLYPHAPRPVFGEAALLIGDAAGLAYPQSGEGIRPAVESALLAADVILAAAGDYRPERLAAYERHLVARFGRRQGGPRPELLPPGLKQFLAARLLSTHWFNRRVVADRWFLHTQQSGLEVA